MLLKRLNTRVTRWLAEYFEGHGVQGHIAVFVILYVIWKNSIKLRHALVRGPPAHPCTAASVR